MLNLYDHLKLKQGTPITDPHNMAHLEPLSIFSANSQSKAANDVSGT